MARDDDRRRDGRTRRELIREGLTVAAGAALLPSLGCGDEPCVPGLADDDDSGDGCGQPAGVIDNAELDRSVIRVHDPAVTDHDYADPAGDPYHLHIDDAVLAAMLSTGVRELTGAPDALAGWSGLFGDFDCHDRVAIKVNFNARKYADEGRLNTSSTMVAAVIDSLLELGFCPEQLTVFDASRSEIPVIVDALKQRHPDVVYRFGSDVQTTDDETIEFPSLIDGARGQPLVLPVPVPVVEAQHLINVHLLKGHHGGVTGACKNLFGLARDVWDTVHGSRDEWPRWDQGVQCAELVRSETVQRRSRLLLCEGLFGTHVGADRPPDPYVEARLWPGNTSPCSLLVSTNHACHDAVMLSLARAERAAAGETNDQADRWLTSLAEAPYSLGPVEIGALAEIDGGRWDLVFDEIRYRTVFLDGGAPA